MTNKLIKQDNVITQARYELSPLEKNIFYMVLSSIREGDPADTLYKISLKEIASKAGVTKITYEDVIRSLEALRKRNIVIEDTNTILNSGFIAATKYIKGSGIIEIEIAHSIRPYFVDLKEKFTLYQLDAALSIKGKYSKRIYEILSQYKNLGRLNMSIKSLKRKLYIIDDNNNDKYPNYAHFERYVLKKAQKELKHHSDIRFSYKVNKLGRAYESIDFIISVPKTLEVEDIKSIQDNSILEKRLSDFKLRKDQIKKVINNHSIEEINKTLYQIQIKAINKSIQDIGAYTAKVFNV